MECGFQIITDSTCDLPKSWVAAHPYVTIVDVPVIVRKEGEESHIFHNLGPDEFHKAEEYVKKGFRASTSQPTMTAADLSELGKKPPESVEEVVRLNANAGKDVVYVVMNGALSSAYQNAMPLFTELQEEYKGSGRRFRCVDSHCMSTGLAMLLMDVDEGIKNGSIKDVDDVVAFVEKQRGYIGHFFTWGELSYIKQSGRVGAVGAAIGTLLGVRLLCSAQYCPDGLRRLEQLTPKHTDMLKVRGIGKWADIIGLYVKRHIQDVTGPIIIAHGNVPRDARMILTRMQSYLPAAKYYVDEWRCGAGIQAHGGPTSIHVNFHVDRIDTLAQTVAEFESIVRA